MKHLGTNQELKTVIVELTQDDLTILHSCVNAAEIRWANKGEKYKAILEDAHKAWHELYHISTKLE